MSKISSFVKRNIDQIIPYITLIIVIALIAIVRPTAFKGTWFLNKIDGTLVLILAALGQTFVMLMGGTDLSIAGVNSPSACRYWI